MTPTILLATCLISGWNSYGYWLIGRRASSILTGLAGLLALVALWAYAP